MIAEVYLSDDRALTILDNYKLRGSSFFFATVAKQWMMKNKEVT